VSKRSIAVVEGIGVGHVEDLEGGTGCTVVLCPETGASAAAVTRGFATSTRQMGIASPLHIVDRAYAVLLAGGSAFGLDAAAGVMRFLESSGRGYPTGHGTVPIVPTAILYDLGLGSSEVRPTPEMAFLAAEKAAAAIGKAPAEGTVGAGTGATIGKLRGLPCATKGGIGTYGMSTPQGLTVGAIVAVNAFGDVLDPSRRCLVAGARRSPRSRRLLDTAREILRGHMRTSFGSTNTTLAVVATNARLQGAWLTRVASWAGDGIAEHLRPAFSVVDGDVVVALATGAIDAEPHCVGLLAREALGRALLRAVDKATPLHGLPTASELPPLPV
jgi:L-aminopeptidase/D-esterase-like protein